MIWFLAGMYCLVLWLVFAKWKLLRLSLPIAIVAASTGPALLVALLFCSQYYHPFSNDVHVLQKVIPVVPQMSQASRVTRITVQPNSPVRKGDVLFEVDTVPYEKTVDRLTAAVAEAKQSVSVAEASVEVSEATVIRARSDLAFMTAERDRAKMLMEKMAISQEQFDEALTRYQQTSSALTEANSGLKQARLSVELAKSRLDQAEASLGNAQYDLDQATVLAPADGYVTNLQLEEGMLVGGPAAAPVMSFVRDRADYDRGVVIALIPQKNYLLIEPEQYAEVVLDGYPGRLFTGRVLNVIDISGAGQLSASGELPDDLGSAVNSRFAVRIRLDDGETLRLPAGSHGLAAVYTKHVPVAGIPVMVLMRMQSWLKYVM
ncbi:MAG: HlyD family secretion protein [Planctomycetaceae bacterium]|nr:HlyD family secretion protein [Planctomycetaceae bacterium]